MSSSCTINKFKVNPNTNLNRPFKWCYIARGSSFVFEISKSQNNASLDMNAYPRVGAQALTCTNDFSTTIDDNHIGTRTAAAKWIIWFISSVLIAREAGKNKNGHCKPLTLQFLRSISIGNLFWTPCWLKWVTWCE